MSPRKLHGLRLVDLSPVLQVLLVPQDDPDRVPPAVERELEEPVLQPREGVPVSQIEDQDGALGPSEVSLGDGAEPLLARSVPQSQSDVPALQHDVLDLELHPDGVTLVRHQDAINVLTEQTGLPHA